MRECLLKLLLYLKVLKQCGQLQVFVRFPSITNLGTVIMVKDFPLMSVLVLFVFNVIFGNRF